MQNGIFISYSHKDYEVAEGITHIIKSSTREEVWFDDRLRGGDNYFSVISNQICKNKYFVFLVSENSVESDWCQKELEFASSEKRKIIAVFLENTTLPKTVKLIIHNTHYINYYLMTEKMFSEAIALAFDDNTEDCADNENSSEYLNGSNEYFLDERKIKNIQRLLSEEKRGRHSVCFKPENCNLLGMAYEFGIKTEINLSKAEFYYKISNHLGDADGKYLYAAIQYKQDTIDGSYAEKTLEAAENGSVLALTQAGIHYFYGEKGFAKNPALARELCHKAAKQENVDAIYYLAFEYGFGNGGENDYDLAYMYAVRAAEYGFPRAFRILGYMYKEGKYFERNTEKAVEMFDEAIKKGDYLSLSYKGDVYGSLGDYCKEFELEKAAARKADEGKISVGLPYYNLGLLYLEGRGVEANPEEAVECFIKGAARGHQKCIRSCAITIRETISEDLQQVYLEKAMNSGCRHAAAFLGLYHCATGENERYTEKAMDYFTKGAETGDMSCVLLILHDCSVAIGNGFDREDNSNALRWFRFLFANADEEFLDELRAKDDDWMNMFFDTMSDMFISHLRNNETAFYNALSLYYFGYAAELCCSDETKATDIEFVCYYLKKALDENPLLLPTEIIWLIDSSCLLSNFSDKTDIALAAKILTLFFDFLEKYHEYISGFDHEAFTALWDCAISYLKTGLTLVADYYASENDTQKEEHFRLQAKNAETVRLKYANKK